MKATLTCVDCSTETERRGPGQKYCESCSEKNDLKRKRIWAKKDYPNKQKTISDVTQRGKTIAAATVQGGMAWMETPPDLAWVIRFTYPYTQALSKNHIYANTAQGHRFLRAESRKAGDDIALLARSAINRSGQKLLQNKVWVDIFVQKSNNRSDAINVVDLVCDGLKIGIGVDDKWFCIRRLDWEISKNDPQIFIGFGQEDVGDVAACSSCGRLLPYDEFRKSRANTNGLDRNCKDCLSSTGKRYPQRGKRYAEDGLQPTA
jgi:hypothetical protein